MPRRSAAPAITRSPLSNTLTNAVMRQFSCHHDPPARCDVTTRGIGAARQIISSVRTTWVLGGLIATAGLLPAAAGGQTLTLRDAVAAALAKNREIVVERESVAQSREGIARAQSAFDPVVR